MKFRTTIEIKDPADWELLGTDVIDMFLEDFPKRSGLTRTPNEDDLADFEDDVTFMYTQKGMELYERMVKRLNTLGTKIFPNEEFSYNPSNMRFP